MTAPKRSPSPRRTSVQHPPASPGVHFLTSGRIVRRLVRDAGLGSGDLVLDLGAGQGHVTAPLAATGARVLAVERDAIFVRELRRRFHDTLDVRVIHADLRTVPLPHQWFRVVASVPFAQSSAILRRLIQPASTRLAGADLIVEWGFAKRVSTAYPRDAETAWWAARYQPRLVRRVPADAFTPAPAVDAAHLRLRQRADLDGRTLRALWWLISTAYARPWLPVRQSLRGVLGRHRGRTLAAHAVATNTSAAGVKPEQWWLLARQLACDATARLPALPKRVR